MTRALAFPLARHAVLGAIVTTLLTIPNMSVWAQKTADDAIQPRYGHCVDVHKDDPRQCGDVNSGKGYRVCESYLKHLNSLKETPFCQIPIPPGFTSPAWEELDLLQHLDWAYWIDIRYAKPAEYTPPDFDTWKKTFMDQWQTGQISPYLRKARIKPFGEDEATIVGYTRDRLACRRVLNKELDGGRWSSGGYVHWELTDDATQSLRKFGDGNQDELLLFAGKPYLVHSYETTWDPSFYIHRMFARVGHDDGLHYATKQLCAMELVPSVKESTR